MSKLCLFLVIMIILVAGAVALFYVGPKPITSMSVPASAISKTPSPTTTVPAPATSSPQQTTVIDPVVLMQNTRVYSNPDLKFSIIYPGEWSYEESLNTVMFRAPLAPYDYGIVIDANSSPIYSRNAQRDSRSFSSSFKSKYPACQMTENYTYIGTVQAVMDTYAYIAKIDQVSSRLVAVFFVYQDYKSFTDIAYRISYDVPEAISDKYSYIFMKMLSGIQLGNQ